MFKFKFLLWVMTRLMQRAIKTNAACARYVAGKRLEFQIQTADKVGRYFRIQDGQVKSYPGLSAAPQFTLTFRNAARGFAILSAKDGKEAFLAGLRDEDLQINWRLRRGDVVPGLHRIPIARRGVDHSMPLIRGTSQQTDARPMDDLSSDSLGNASMMQRGSGEPMALAAWSPCSWVSRAAAPKNPAAPLQHL